MSIKYNVTVVFSNNATGEHNVSKFVLEGKTADNVMDEALKKVNVDIEDYDWVADYDLADKDDDTGIMCTFGKYQKLKSGDIEYIFVVEIAYYQ